ncbi:hypothetical protein J6590_021119 [Homalodisca vitripennis]|nr:hypothetical protein J6590_021119 [Homalodisca vitripennis]
MGLNHTLSVLPKMGPRKYDIQVHQLGTQDGLHGYGTGTRHGPAGCTLYISMNIIGHRDNGGSASISSRVKK